MAHVVTQPEQVVRTTRTREVRQSIVALGAYFGPVRTRGLQTVQRARSQGTTISSATLSCGWRSRAPSGPTGYR
jgi:hypothetical protein